MLPQGFTRVEWIESTGEQYINTRYKPNNNTRLVMDCTIENPVSSNYITLFGARDAELARCFALLVSPSNKFYANIGIRTDYYTYPPSISVVGHHVIDANKNTITIDENSHTFTARTFQNSTELFIFANNANNSTKFYGAFKVGAVKIYDNGTLVRDYIPCIDENGDANLWDDVEGALADKKGTFVAGPVDTVPLTLNLITDRTDADVAEAKRLRGKIFAGEALTDEEFARYSAGLRGCYNASDMNRVGAAVRYVANRLNAEGYGAYVDPKTDWQMEDIARQSDWNKYLDEVRHLRRKLTLMRTTPQITDGMYSGLKSYAEANAIEQILVDLDWMLTNIIRNYIYAGEVFAGEV